VTTNLTRAPSELTNARTRIVGERDGALADAIVTAVRLGRAVRRAVIAAGRAVSSVVTGLGWCVAVVTLAAVGAGYLLGWTEAIVVGWAGVALSAIAGLYLIGGVAQRVRVELTTHRVVVGQRALAALVVENPLRRRLGAARVEVPVGAGVAEFATPPLAREGRHDDVFVIPTVRRSVIAVGPARVVRADPVGLVRRRVQWTEVVELFVHPKTVAIPSMSTGFVRDLEGNPTRDLTASDVSFHALREYVPGDEQRIIHWKSSAKTGSFMVRQFEETRRSHLLAALSLASADFAGDEEFELAVSVTGSLGVRAIHDGRTVSVTVSEKTPDFAKRPVFAVRRLSTVTPDRLLDDLSRIEHVETALRIADLARVSADEASGVSIAFLVCGSTVGAARLRHASAQFPPGVEVVAIVCDPGAAPGLRRVGELSVLTIGYLDDLQKALARSRAT
jgi:Uncharacterized conserved protein (some members contain a von Willebrand factor type A (vWA) domain)